MTRWLRLSIVWFGTAVVTGSAAFFGVALAMRGDNAAPPTVAQLHDAREIAALAADLHSLLNDAGPPQPASPSNTIRLNALRARIREKQSQIVRAKLSGPAFTALVISADRLTAYAAQPQSDAAYAAAIKAQEDTEARVRAEHRKLEEKSNKGHKR